MATNNLEVLTQGASNWDPKLMPSEYGVSNTVQRADHPECFSSLGKRSQEARMNMNTARVIASLVAGDAGEVAIIKKSAGQYAAERTGSDGTTTIVTCTKAGLLSAAQVSPKGIWTSVSLPDNSVDMIPFYAVYLMMLCKTDMLNESTVRLEAQNRLETILSEKNLAKTWTDAFFLSDTLYYAMKGGYLKGNITNGKVSLLTEERVIHGSLNGEILCGTPKFINDSGVKGGTKTMQAKDLKKMFAEFASKKQWSASEEQFIPQFPDDYPVMPEVVTIANRYVASRNAKVPMNNFLWRGITSYGKSTGVELIAYALHMPLLRLTCNSTMEAQDFLSQYVPDNSGTRMGRREMPSFQEIAGDPESAYEKLTGEYVEGITPEEVLEMYGKVAAANSKGSSGTGTKYKLVESNYVKALRRGYICEIQEMSRIKDAGVMVTLNEYDRANAIIPLADGNYCRRDPNAMVIYTDNIGYTSCRPVDPSVMRRMDNVFDSREMSDQLVIDRVIYNTGFQDKDYLKKMVRVWREIKDFCKKNDITDGEISVRELERWVNVLLIEGLGSVETACRECVIAKASPEQETQEEIFRAVTKAMADL